MKTKQRDTIIVRCKILLWLEGKEWLQLETETGGSWGEGGDYHLPRYIYTGLVLVLPKKKEKSQRIM